MPPCDQPLPPLTQGAVWHLRSAWLAELRRLAGDHLLAAFGVIELVEARYITDEVSIDLPAAQARAYLDAVAVVTLSGAPLPARRRDLCRQIKAGLSDAPSNRWKTPDQPADTDRHRCNVRFAEDHTNDTSGTDRSECKTAVLDHR